MFFLIQGSSDLMYEKLFKIRNMLQTFKTKSFRSKFSLVFMSDSFVICDQANWFFLVKGGLACLSPCPWQSSSGPVECLKIEGGGSEQSPLNCVFKWILRGHWSQRQMQQYELCLKSFLSNFGSSEVPYMPVKKCFWHRHF